jgi:hypothetical protein
MSQKSILYLHSTPLQKKWATLFNELVCSALHRIHLALIEDNEELNYESDNSV